MEFQLFFPILLRFFNIYVQKIYNLFIQAVQWVRILQYKETVKLILPGWIKEDLVSHFLSTKKGRFAAEHPFYQFQYLFLEIPTHFIKIYSSS